jgi:NAD(P)H-hydrate epimerase
MGRLCDLSIAEVLSQRWHLARQKAAAWKVVLLVKGPYTVVADPQGWLAVLPIATAALATAGTGDVLAGTITGLIAQKVAPFQAACLGAWLHGMAGQQCQAEIGPAGVVASDLLSRLPAVMNSLRTGG